MSDLIDRQRAIATFHVCAPGIPLKILTQIFAAIPSAQPEIIRCKDCKHWKNEHLCECLSRFGSFETKADYYCGYAERRTGETN